jgi:hypothetical protein
VLNVDAIQKQLHVTVEFLQPSVEMIAAKTLVTQLREDVPFDGFIQGSIDVFQKIFDLFLIHLLWHTDFLLFLSADDRQEIFILSWGGRVPETALQGGCAASRLPNDRLTQRAVQGETVAARNRLAAPCQYLPWDGVQGRTTCPDQADRQSKHQDQSECNQSYFFHKVPCQV